MDHHLVIVLILTVGFALASSLAYLMQKLKLPSILGYLLAGFFIGPYSPGFVADITISEQLAEIGVILMLFGVGLHFQLQDLIQVKHIAIPGAILQTFVTTVVAMGVVHLEGWSLKAGLIVGLSIGVASTVVLVRILSENHLLHTKQGHIAVGWLVVEDIFTVIILLMLPILSFISQGDDISWISILGSIGLILAKFGALVLFMFTWGYRIVVYILKNIARLRSQELFTLTVLALVFMIATGSSLIFGTSIALGAFIAGMVIGKTNVKHQAASNALPLKDIFAIMFFLSVGMLFNPFAIVNDTILFIGITAVILIVKPLIAYFITMFFGYSLKTALTIAVSLAQIGEFSFILAEEAMKLNLLPDTGFDILVASSIISISLNPLLFQAIGFFESTIEKMGFFRGIKNHSAQSIQSTASSLNKIIVIGFGPIGREVVVILKKLGFMPIVIEHNIDTVSNLEEQDALIFGDAADVNILKDAYIEEASHLIITIPDTRKTLEIIHAARQESSTIEIIARVQFIGQQPTIEELNVHYICTENEALKAFSSLIHHLLPASEKLS